MKRNIKDFRASGAFIHIPDKETYKKMIPVLHKIWRGWDKVSEKFWGNCYVSSHDTKLTQSEINRLPDPIIYPASDFLDEEEKEINFDVFN